MTATKIALVTGAGSGIGKATAQQLAKHGARVVVVDLDEKRVADMARELGDACAFSRAVDVSKRDAMRSLADDVHAKLGALDVLVNNAGVGHSGGILDTTLEDWDWVVNVNLWGVIHGCHFFAPKMVDSGRGGHIANVASGFGLLAAPGVAPYCTTKFAVVGLSESLRGELQPHNIGVSAICPGLINTDIINRGRFADEKLRGTMAKTFHDKGRSPDEVARAILHAIRGNVAVVPVGAEAWVGWFGKRLAPGLVTKLGQRVEKMAKARAAKEAAV
jgi:NAD(P)-dependent dehydrogenase (short-subunit alcohol dehydrogenase family)